MEHVGSNGASLGASRLVLALLLSSAPNYQALELYRRPGGARRALDALKALALTLGKALGLISLALELVLGGAQDCKVLNQTVALVALDAITRS